MKQQTEIQAVGENPFSEADQQAETARQEIAGQDEDFMPN